MAVSTCTLRFSQSQSASRHRKRHHTDAYSLRGPAPIQWTVIQDRQRTGVTIQTLDEIAFDKGRILSQTVLAQPLSLNGEYQPSSAGLIYRSCEAELARIGAAALSKTIQDGLFVAPETAKPPLYIYDGKPTASSQDHRAAKGRNTDLLTISPVHDGSKISQQATPTFAPKVKKEDRRIDWPRWTWRAICLRYGVLGPLFDESIHAACSLNGRRKRVVFHHLEAVSKISEQLERFLAVCAPGTPFLLQPDMASEASSNLLGSAELATSSGRVRRFVPIMYTQSRGKTRLDDMKVAAHAAEDLREGIFVATADGIVLHIKNCTIDSGKAGQGQVQLRRMLIKKMEAARGTTIEHPADSEG
jgi:hypothetical protein